MLPSLLDLVVPGIGHLVRGYRRPGLVFLVPPLLLVLALIGELAARGPFGLLAIAVAPGVLPALFLLNIALAAWRIAAGIDTVRRSGWTHRSGAILGVGILVLVVVPHVVAGQYIASVSDYLDATFANIPDATDTPDTADASIGSDASPDASLPTDVGSFPDASGDPPSGSPGPTGTQRPPATPRPPMTSGIGTLPALGVAVPWQRPGEVPWGEDGRFDLLLLGSDAGIDRWSRRMDVMLLVEIDVATGKVAMIGLPRNLVNAPFPPGAARDAVACGCFTGLLNGLYVEATSTHPSRWPGSGAVKGIGAVRAVVSELTGRPIDAVLVADLWGVIKVVDAMGGIDINVPASVHDDHYPDPIYGDVVLDIRAGKQHLDGRTALAYTRTRHQDSDYSRMARQQTLLLAIRSQIGIKTILNAPALFNAAKGFSWTDLPRSSLPNLVDLFGRASSASVKQLRIVPSRYPAWLTPSEITQIRADIAALLGTVPPPSPSPSPSPSESPSPSASPEGSPPDGSPTPSPSGGSPSPMASGGSPSPSFAAGSPNPPTSHSASPGPSSAPTPSPTAAASSSGSPSAS
jgi:polyisoprenyl-teichoic acid--peptidoglycan teichoic acid transferase